MSDKIERTIIRTSKAPEAIGPYSGSLGLVPGTTNLIEGGIKEETHQALKNIGEILNAAGATYNNVVKTTILLADINDFPLVNEIYQQYFKNNFPARATYQVANLPKNGRVEIEAIAVVGDIVETRH